METSFSLQTTAAYASEIGDSNSDTQPYEHYGHGSFFSAVAGVAIHKQGWNDVHYSANTAFRSGASFGNVWGIQLNAGYRGNRSYPESTTSAVQFQVNGGVRLDANEEILHSVFGAGMGVGLSPIDAMYGMFGGEFLVDANNGHLILSIGVTLAFDTIGLK